MKIEYNPYELQFSKLLRSARQQINPFTLNQSTSDKLRETFEKNAQALREAGGGNELIAELMMSAANQFLHFTDTNKNNSIDPMDLAVIVDELAISKLDKMRVEVAMLKSIGEALYGREHPRYDMKR